MENINRPCKLFFNITVYNKIQKGVKSGKTGDT